jgi:hypothetical protein
MNVSDIFKNAFKFPASNWKRFLILGIIILTYTLLATSNVYLGSNPFTLLMILPAYFLLFLVMGYTLKTIKISINEENELPAFNKWKKMFIDGLKVFLISILYFIIPTIFIMAGIFLAIDFSAITTGKLQFNFFNPATIIVLSIGVLLYVFLMFFFEIGLANMAYKGKLEAALSLSEIRSIIRKIGWKKYLAIFLILLIISGISNIFGYVFNQMPIYGLIIFAILISPYLTLISPRAVGLIYKEAL